MIEINKSNISNFFLEYQNYQEQIKNNLIVNADTFQISNVSPVDYLRSFIDFEFSEHIIKDFIAERFVSLDSYCPAGVYYLSYFLNYAIENNINSLLLEDAESITVEPSLENIFEIIDNMFASSNFINEKTAKEIFLKNGFISKFVVKKSNSNNNACVFQSGYQIKGSIEETQRSQVASEETSLFDCKILMYDGVIESISEMEKLLQYSSSNKQPILVICRKASKDVGYTCALNNQMGKTNIHIFIPNHEFWDEQKIDLISQGIFCYGFETGTLLSMVKEEELFSCDISIKPEGLFLKDKSFGINFDALTTLFISDSYNNQIGIINDQLNLYRALLQQISLCGVVSNNSFLEKTGIDIKILTGSNCEYHPAFPVFRAYQEAKYIKDKIVNIGCLIKEESNDG